MPASTRPLTTPQQTRHLSPQQSETLPPHSRDKHQSMETAIQADRIPDLSGQIFLWSVRPVFNGQYSSVYHGRFGDKLVAVKVIKEIFGAHVHTMERKLKRELATWAPLRHPNILPFLGFANDHELFQPFGALISPWRARGNACQFLKDRGSDLTSGQRLNLWKGVAGGVEYLHNHAPTLVHGDLKLANVMINDEGHPQLCDFGLISVFLEEGHSGMTTTSPHTGTDRYLAYELVRDGDTVIPTVASDIFALGCVGLEFYFLKLPYAHRPNNMQGRITADIRAKIPPAAREAACDSDSKAVWDLLEHCWAVDPSRRPTARELLAALRSQPQPPALDVNFGRDNGDDAATEQNSALNSVEWVRSPSSMPQSPATGDFSDEPEMKPRQPPIGVNIGPEMNASDEPRDRRTHTRRLSDVLRESHCMNYEWRPTSFVVGKTVAGKSVILHRAEFWFEGKAYGSSPNSHLSAEAAREETATYVLPSIIRALKAGKKEKKVSIEII